MEQTRRFPLSAFYFPFSARRRARRGQVVVESLVALGILTVGFLGILTLLSRSISLNRVVSDNYTATYLAAEGLEVVKNIIDTNVIQNRPWNSGFSNGDFEVQYASALLEATQSRFLLFDPSQNLYSYGGSVVTPFTRTIRVALVGGNEIKVNSIVSWSSRGGEYDINLEDHFFNWRPQN